jgi:predicted Zn-dependent protease
LALFLAGILLGVGCSFHPAPARVDRPEQPERQEAAPRNDFELGLRIAMELDHEIGLVREDSLLRRVNEVGYRVAYVAPRAALFSFHVLDRPEPNAFAIPGGFLFVTRGMLETGITDAELAALIGHEIGHITRGHFARSQRLSSILSIAQVALLVGALMAGDNGGSQGARYERTDEDIVYRGTSGSQAVAEGVPIFGGLLRTLIERKYSRGFEYEADDTGARLAAQAGYPPSAAADLLLRLRERAYEDSEYGYWRTHPFFPERVERVSAVAAGLVPPVEPLPDFAFRQSVQHEFVRMASRREREAEAVFLYRIALRVEPHGMTALEAGRKLLEFRVERDRRRPALNRMIRPIVAEYDSLITATEKVQPGGALAWKLRASRDSLEAERNRLLPDYLEELDRDLKPTTLFERFLENYPDHPRAPAICFALAENYRRSGRPDLAVPRYLRLFRDHPDSSWLEPALGALHETIPRVSDPIVLQRVLGAELPDTLLSRAAARMDTLLSEVDSMEDAAAFLHEFPESRYAEPMRCRLEEQAEEAYRQARVLEGVDRAQQALDAYHRILFVAPETRAAGLARERIDFLVRTG